VIVHVEDIESGALWRVRLNTPKANIVDREKIKTLDEIFRKAAAAPRLKGVLLEGEGPNFSFGASVEEHLPGQYETMIPAFNALFRTMLDSGVVVLAAIRGHCLGGGLELAAFAHRVFAAHDARLGQPEIVLGVFAPIASVILTERIGRSRAEDLCLSGRMVGAEEAHRIGLVDEVVQDPDAAALAYAREYLLPRSAMSLRLAQRAVRAGFRRRMETELKEIEHLYMNELMKSHDAEEGLRSFLEKRAPQWTDS